MGSIAEPGSEPAKKPLGIRFVEYVKGGSISFKTHQAIVLVLTFLAYASYHAARKTTSVMKSALDPASTKCGLSFSPLEKRPVVTQNGGLRASGWAPFNGSDGSSLLGELDVAFLAVYASGIRGANEPSRAGYRNTRTRLD